MSRNIIVVHPVDDQLVIWFEGGVSRSYTAQDLGMTDPEQMQHVRIVNDESAIAWDTDSLDAETLLERGTQVDYVTSEKRRLLKCLSVIRREAEFSQTRLGDAAGIRQSVISRIEGCEISPQINTLLKLLAPLGKTLAIVDLTDEA